MAIVIGIAAAVVILVWGLLFYLANGARISNGRQDLPAPKQVQKQRAAGID
jgi:hypothetical protein